MSVIDRRLTQSAPAPPACPAPSSGNSVVGVAGGNVPASTLPFEALPTSAPRSQWHELLKVIWPYVQIARIDHWFKNVFMILGVVLAFFYEPTLFAWSSVPPLALALLATCLIASSNYVLNELLDGPLDRLHPTKRLRPVPSGQIRPAVGYAEWILIGAVGLALAWQVNAYFAASGALLWMLGVAYNVPPVRTKEWPYIDVLSESANNAVRLLLGWFPLISDRFPPLSLILSYWMVGAFFMATKRLAEYRHLSNPAVAAAYRRSFRHYNEERLLVSLMFYATSCGLFAGIFIVRYHLELILFVPVAAGVLAYYLRIGLQPNSPAQNPEKLYRKRGFLAYLVASAVLFVILMFTRIPALYDWFNVAPAAAKPLWTLGTGKG
jgi:decaprenyl-phosphate phosphoribosyltransferase